MDDIGWRKNQKISYENMTKAVKETLIDTFGKDFNELFQNMYELNDFARKKIYEYASDLTKIKEYRI